MASKGKAISGSTQRGAKSTSTPSVRTPRRRQNTGRKATSFQNAKDRELIAWFHAGDDQALEALFDRYEESLFHFLVGVLKNHHLAEDAIQETWCQAIKHMDRVNGNQIRGWLFTVAYHQAMLFKRRRKDETYSVAATAQMVDPTPCPHTQAQHEEEKVRVMALLDRLPVAQREVICQRIYEDKRFRDIAETMDCPINTALARMHDGLRRLKRLWGPDYA